MRKLLLPLCTVLAGTLAMTGLALGDGIVGGDDETSEDMTTAFVIAPPNPGTVGPGGFADQLLISEVVMTPTAGEFIEICNSTGNDVDLTNFYLTDDWFTGTTPPACYCEVVTPGYSVGTGSDYNVRFPAGTIIPPGGVIVVAVSGTGFFTTYGALPDFEIRSDSTGVADMINVGGNSFFTALITNSSEFVMLYCWDGASDLVCDVDYVTWGDPGASGNGVDKTGRMEDGPDADAVPSTYNADTAPALQLPSATAPFGSSLQRAECQERPERQQGNGCTDGGVPVEPSTWGSIKAKYN